MPGTPLSKLRTPIENGASNDDFEEEEGDMRPLMEAHENYLTSAL